MSQRKQGPDKWHRLLLEYLGIEHNKFAQYLLFVAVPDRGYFDEWLKEKAPNLSDQGQ